MWFRVQVCLSTVLEILAHLSYVAQSGVAIEASGSSFCSDHLELSEHVASVSEKEDNRLDRATPHRLPTSPIRLHCPAFGHLDEQSIGRESLLATETWIS